MPVASAKKARGKTAKTLKRLEKSLTAALSDFDVVDLRKNKREKVMRINAKRLPKEALKRAKKKKSDFVLTTFASGKGRRLVLRASLIDVKTKKTVWQAKLKPTGKDKKKWTTKIKEGLSPFLVVEEAPAEAAPEPAANAEPEPKAEPAAVAAKEEATPAKSEPVAAAATSEGETAANTAPNEAATASQPEPENLDEGGSLAWLWYSSGGALGVVGLGAFAASGTVFYLAMVDSNAFVASAAQNPELKESSETKGLIADALWISGTVLTVAAVGLVSVGLVSSLSE